ncbi:hypothetical protein F5883DRAFT_587491 [Diaporthe sp. PMI_573]|nr:hypothetical protein F5883DRAFT_587491 [Diaporthaceae sp. PMI_573]
MNNITLQEGSIRWRISYILVFALAHLLTALHILAVLLTRRKKRKVSGQRSPLLQDSRAFLYLFVFGCIAAVIPSVVLLLLAPRYVKPGLDLYVIHFGLYFTLSGERFWWTRIWADTGPKCKIAAITCDKVVLGLLVGSVPLSRLSPVGAKVLVLLTIFGCRMWSAWECFALWKQCRQEIEASPVDLRALRGCLVGTLVANVLHLLILLILLIVWFTLRINHHRWFSLVAYFSCVPVEVILPIRQIWGLSIREKNSGCRNEPLQNTGPSDSQTSLQHTVDVPHGLISGWDSD